MKIKKEGKEDNVDANVFTKGIKKTLIWVMINLKSK